jgi:leucyl aminopeptidase
MPLHKGYRGQLDSPVADLNNVTDGGYGGAITAALFLQEFVEPSIPWVHIDLMAWNVGNRPGRPKGGEAMALRAVYALIAEKAAASRSAAKGKSR